MKERNGETRKKGRKNDGETEFDGGTEGTNVEIGKCENVEMNGTPKIEKLKWEK